MKVLILALAVFFIGLQQIKAQIYNPIKVKGYNHDVIADGDGNSALATTTKEMDAISPSNYVLCTKQFANANGFQPANLYGLPNSGTFSVPGRKFQMAPFDSNNVLYLMAGESGILELVQPARYTDFSLLSMATEGDAQVSIRFQFSDGTTQLLNKTIEDWFNTIVPQTFSGYGRVKRKDGPINPGDYEAAQQGNPRFRNLDFVLPCEKTLVSLEVSNSGIIGNQSNRAFILAVSGLERTASPSITISTKDTSACLGQPMRFVSKPDSGGNSPQFAWRINDGPVLGTDSVFTSSILQDGDTVTCTLNSNAFCALPDTAVSNRFVVSLKPLRTPIAIVVPEDSIACEGEPLKFFVQTENCGDNPTFRWFLNNTQSSSTGANYTVPGIEAGDSIKCLVRTSETCLTIDRVLTIPVGIAVTPVIDLKAELPPVVLLGDPALKLIAQPATGQFSGPGVNQNQFDPINAGTGKHTLLVYVPENNCSDTLKKEIIVCNPVPTNLVIPSGEKANQVWTVESPGFSCSEKTEVNVYDRWGKEVKAFDNYLNDWNGSDLIPGCYFYRVSYSLLGRTNKLVKTGHITFMP